MPESRLQRMREAYPRVDGRVGMSIGTNGYISLGIVHATAAEVVDFLRAQLVFFEAHAEETETLGR